MIQINLENYKITFSSTFLIYIKKKSYLVKFAETIFVKLIMKNSFLAIIIRVIKSGNLFWSIDNA